MKKLLLLALFPFALFAEDTLFLTQNDPNPYFPFSLGGSFVNVKNAKVTNDPWGFEQTIHFKQCQAAFSHISPVTDVSGLIFGAGYVGSEIKLSENFAFEQTIFHYVNFLVGGYTSTCDWIWRATAAVFLDTEEFSFIDYARYQTVLWGQHYFNPNFELDFGFITESGLHKTKVWPILGFIYTPIPKLEIHAVFPVDLAINYNLTQNFIASASVRFLRSRHRLKDTEPNSQGLFDYRTTGLELDLTYTCAPRVSITLFAGTTTGGKFRICNRKNHFIQSHLFKSSAYTGFSSTLSY